MYVIFVKDFVVVEADIAVVEVDIEVVVEVDIVVVEVDIEVVVEVDISAVEVGIEVVVEVDTFEEVEAYKYWYVVKEVLVMEECKVEVVEERPHLGKDLEAYMC